MGRPNKIRQAGKEAAVRKLAARGLTCREIADELAKHGLRVSHMAVQRFIQEETEERRDAARSVAAREAQTSVPLVTSKLQKWVETVDTLIDEAMASREPAGGAQKGKKGRGVAMVAADVARLVNAGTKAAKALHDVTVGDGPSSSVESLRDEVQGILARRAQRETQA